MKYDYDVLNYRYPSRREVVYGRKGMVCTSQNLAAEAGLEILKAGGNAVDAALATAACMVVLEPTSNGFGSDAFSILHIDGKIYGINASGHSPELLTLEEIKGRGLTSMPKYGWTSVTVPGAVNGWAMLSERFGKLPLEKVFEPAIRYAEEGYVVTPIISRMWAGDYDRLKAALPEELFNEWAKVFAPDGHAPKAGEIWSSRLHADTFRELAKSGCDSFYRGKLAAQMDEWSKQTGGYLRKSDLEKYHAQWVDPISTNYKGYDIWEIPPNGHGITALMALNIVENMDVTKGHDDEAVIHMQLEAMKMAFADAQKYVADPRFMDVTPSQLLSKDYAKKRSERICDKALEPEYGDPASGGTIYLCTADSDGNMVSYIQSNYCLFGSGIVIPGTGIALQNRGFNFYVDEKHSNCVGPLKKPYHTIIPGFITKDGEAVGPFGVMGGFMQPQGHMQVVMNLIDFAMNPQEAIDAPRWQWTGGMNIEIEQGFSATIANKLIARGHQIKVNPDSIDFGRGQMILRDEDGILTGATEGRTDGAVAAW